MGARQDYLYWCSNVDLEVRAPKKGKNGKIFNILGFWLISNFYLANTTATVKATKNKNVTAEAATNSTATKTGKKGKASASVVSLTAEATKAAKNSTANSTKKTKSSASVVSIAAAKTKTKAAAKQEVTAASSPTGLDDATIALIEELTGLKVGRDVAEAVSRLVYPKPT